MPLILLCFLVAFLFVAGTIAASDAFFEQLALQSDCDAAAESAASAVDGDAFAAEQNGSDIPLTQSGVQQAVDHYVANDMAPDSSTVMAGSVGPEGLTIACRRTVTVPFGTLFGWGDGLERTATSSGRSPLTTPRALR